MDKKPAVGNRIHFRFVLTTTPTRLVLGGEKQAVVIVNELASACRIGPSGMTGVNGMYLPATMGFTDNYSRDEWWGWTESGSGTVSGFIVP